MTELMAEVNGIQLCYEELGDPTAPAMLLIMGLGGPMIWWDDAFCQALVDRGYRVVRFDNRDAGRSQSMPGAVPSLRRLGRSFIRPDPQPAYTLDDMADDVVGLMEHLGIAS